MQNASAKLILGKKNDHVTPLFKQLHWLPLYQRCVYKSLLIICKTLQGDSQVYLKEMLDPSSCEGLGSFDDIRNLSVNKETKPVTFGDFVSSIYSPKMWNNLPQDIRAYSSVKSLNDFNDPSVTFPLNQFGYSKAPVAATEQCLGPCVSQRRH